MEHGSRARLARTEDVRLAQGSRSSAGARTEVVGSIGSRHFWRKDTIGKSGSCSYMHRSRAGTGSLARKEVGPGWDTMGSRQFRRIFVLTTVSFFGPQLKSPVSAHVRFGHRFLFSALGQSPSQGTLWFTSTSHDSHHRAHVSMGSRFFWIWIGFWGWPGRQPLDWKF